MFDKLKAVLYSSGLLAAVLGAAIGLEPAVDELIASLPLGSFWVAVVTAAVASFFGWLRTERTGYGAGVTTDVDAE